MRLLLADDHPMFLDAVRGHIERMLPETDIVVCNSFAGVLDELASGPAVDLVLLDFSMPGLSGLDSVRQLRESYPDLTVAVTSGIAEPHEIRAVIELGAKGFLPKSLSGAAYAGALQIIADGGTYLPIDVMSSMSSGADKAPSEYVLTPRERDVLKGLAMSKPNKQIARDLEVSLVTVKVHVRNIFRKLDVQNRSQAAIMAREKKLVDFSE